VTLFRDLDKVHFVDPNQVALSLGGTMKADGIHLNGRGSMRMRRLLADVMQDKRPRFR
jgi:lysophospholipase L1-like esterase